MSGPSCGDRVSLADSSKGRIMSDDTMVAVFANHEQAEQAVKDLAAAKFDMKQLSIVGKGYHTEEQVVGFYNTGDRMKFWGKRGAFWGGLWGLFFGGVFLMVPVVGQVMVLGYLATVIASAVEGAVVVGGVSALGAALAGLGVPKDSVLQYETALKADEFLVTAHGSAQELGRAKVIVAAAGAASVELHNSASTSVLATLS
jgi:hypothetical protein